MVLPHLLGRLAVGLRECRGVPSIPLGRGDPPSLSPSLVGYIFIYLFTFCTILLNSFFLDLYIVCDCI